MMGPMTVAPGEEVPAEDGAAIAVGAAVAVAVLTGAGPRAAHGAGLAVPTDQGHRAWGGVRVNVAVGAPALTGAEPGAALEVFPDLGAAVVATGAA